MWYFYVTSSEDMQIMAKIKEHKPISLSWFLHAQWTACGAKGPRFA